MLKQECYWEKLWIPTTAVGSPGSNLIACPSGLSQTFISEGIELLLPCPCLALTASIALSRLLLGQEYQEASQ